MFNFEQAGKGELISCYRINVNQRTAMNLWRKKIGQADNEKIISPNVSHAKEPFF